MHHTSVVQSQSVAARCSVSLVCALARQKAAVATFMHHYEPMRLYIKPQGEPTVYLAKCSDMGYDNTTVEGSLNYDAV
jgi:hypothetical protein